MDPSIQLANFPELGIPEMDAQHRAMLESLSRLRSSPRDPGRDAILLHAIVEDVRSHFAWEDAEMEAAAYPDRKRHFKDHHSQLANLSDLLKFVEQGHQPLDVDFLLACEGWTARHVQSMDAEFARFLADRETWDLQEELKAWEYEGLMAALPD